MKTILGAIPLAAVLAMMGCTTTVYETTSPRSHEHEEEAYQPYVDAHVYIPYEVALLIEESVDGFAMPRVSNYGPDLYPYATPRDPDNLPCFVRDDFNGDGYDDFAMMFSRERYTSDAWFVTTKLLVVVSDGWGDYDFSLELILGTVTADIATPVEEYWAIGLMEPGVHTVRTYYSGRVVEESVELDNGAIYLTSLDPAERSLFYVMDDETYEMAWDMGALAKKKPDAASRGDRIIQLNKSASKENG
jgi:hypothetical protein